MSQLIDRLNRVGRSAPPTMGFRASRPAPVKSRMLLVASLTDAEDIAGLSHSLTVADAVLLHITGLKSANSQFQKTARSLPDIPWGAWLEDVAEKGLEALVKAGCDFTVFPAMSRVSAIPQDSKIGRILLVETSISDGLLRTVNELSVDAVLLAAETDPEPSLTWRRLMLVQHIASLLAKPLLIALPPGSAAGDLKALWKAGVDGIVVASGSGQPEGRLEELRRAIDELSLLPPRRRGKTEALLPRIGPEATAAAPPEEDDDDV